MPAGYALGAMATSIVAKFTGLFDGQLPPFFLETVFVLVGALIGSRFAGITLRGVPQGDRGGSRRDRR